MHGREDENNWETAMLGSREDMQAAWDMYVGAFGYSEQDMRMVEVNGWWELQIYVEAQ